MGVLGRRQQATRHRALFSRPRRAITAAAERARDSPGALLRLDQGWQREAMRIYRTQGECANPAQYQARAMERIRYYPAILDERGVPVESTDSNLVGLFRRIHSPGGSPGDLSELAGQYARLQFVIGDGLLTVSEQNDDEVWEYLSPMEMRMLPRPDKNAAQDYQRYRAPGAPPEELTEAADSDFSAEGLLRVWRLWRKHIQYSQWADSPVRSSIRLYDLLERLTMAANAEASSRAAQRGALVVPEELSFGPADTTQEEDPTQDPLLTELRDAMERALADPDSAEAMAPFLFRVPGVTQTAGGALPTADLIKWIPLGPSDRYAEAEMWDAVISRIAGNIDMPKELMLGLGGISHWTSWFLGAEGFNQHTGPTLVRFCNDIASAYLRPAALDAGIPNAGNVTVWYDPSQAINHPDETGTALKAQDQGIISREFTATKLGYPESSAPSDSEFADWVAIKLRQFPSDLQPEPQTGETPPQQGGQGADTTQGPPATSERRQNGSRPPSPAPSMSAMLAGAAMMQVDRGRELAGNRLVNRAQSCGECQEEIKGVKSALVAAALGADVVRSMIAGHTTEASLVQGIGEMFADRVRAWGVNGGWPEQLGAMVEQHALRTLYEDEVPPLPPGFLAACQKAVG